MNCTHDGGVCGLRETERRHEVGADYLGFQLYDIGGDPGEHDNVADSNKDVVLQMKAMMEDMEKGGVAQQVDDSSCPAQTPGYNRIAGKTTIPWC